MAATMITTSPNGKMALLFANGSMSSQTNNEGEIRKAIINADLVECMAALPGQLFTNTQILACIWFLNRNKSVKAKCYLSMPAKSAIGKTAYCVISPLTTSPKLPIPSRLAKIRRLRQVAFCKSATLEEIKDNDFALTPGRYVGTAEQEDDGVPFAEKCKI
ncbi:MAG: N-6 DNA methylase [Haemophilus parainfluenzae]